MRVGKITLVSRLELPRFTPRKKEENAPYRINNKDGKVQIGLQQISFFKRRRYWKNILTTVLQLKWRWIKRCVGTYDGEICLMVRVGNMRQCNLVSVMGYEVLIDRETIEARKDKYYERNFHGDHLEELL
ncbi:hypothetical protein CHS0354_007305 [Potamilus streckersoni]|uniref:Uncharacterized protein n=1 Tax=Potamilus streckersoni TaxID=2493646 RepID=A0AAE0TDC4_9BIVA|nr:hypothetical protein CHS0354_007305 [Potamilus streckersoni]